MNNNSLLIILSVLVFFFVVLPTLAVSIALGGLLWLVAIVMFLWGWAGRQTEIKAERIRRRGELEEEGRQRAVERYDGPPEQIIKESVVTREVVLNSMPTLRGTISARDSKVLHMRSQPLEFLI